MKRLRIVQNFVKEFVKLKFFDSKWKFLGFDDSGNADFFYIEEINQNIIKVRLKQIFSERGKQNVIERIQSKLNVIEYEKLDYTLYLLKIDCFKRKFQMLEASNYASGGSILDTFKVPKSLSKWFLIPSNSNTDIEKLFEEVCVKRNQEKQLIVSFSKLIFLETMVAISVIKQVQKFVCVKGYYCY